MTDEQIIKLATRYGYAETRYDFGTSIVTVHFIENQLQAFAKELIQLQREKDVKICENVHSSRSSICGAFAESIREGGI